ncbi:MAG: hypothetical protein J7539_00230 [Niabella sp.]|nr:hypothetical protein [Niabella sp.]
MRLILCGILCALLLGGCSKSLSDHNPSANDLASSCSKGACVLPNFYVQLIDKNTGGNYIAENNITTAEIELRNAQNQPISYNVSVTSLNDSLSNIIVFPVADQYKVILRIRKALEIPIAYTATVAGAAGVKLSNFTVNGYIFTTATINKNYLLRIKI